MYAGAQGAAVGESSPNSSSSRLPHIAQKKHHLYGRRGVQEQATSELRRLAVAEWSLSEFHSFEARSNTLSNSRSPHCTQPHVSCASGGDEWRYRNDSETNIS